MNNYSIKYTRFLPAFIIFSLLLLIAGYTSTAHAIPTQQQTAGATKNIELACGYAVQSCGWNGPRRYFYPSVRYYRYNHCCSRRCVANECGVVIRCVRSCGCN